MDKKIKERGIIFNGEMVRAILDGSKTQTRRAIKSPATTLQNNGTNCIAYREAGDPWYKDYVFSMRGRSGVWNDYTLPQFLALCPFGKVGDRLWVREDFGFSIRSLGGTPHMQLVFRASRPDAVHYYDCNGVPSPMKWSPSSRMPREYSRITLEITDIRVERNGDQWEWVVEFKRVEAA